MGFDLTTHHRTKKGNIERVTPYRLRVVDGIQRFERPVGSGKWYDAQGTLVEETEPTIKEEILQDSPEVAELKAKLAALEAKLESTKVDDVIAASNKEESPSLANQIEVQKKVK